MPALPALMHGFPRTGNIFKDWIDAIKNGKKSCNDFSISSKLTEIMLLTNIAVRSQKSDMTLEYDAANMKITNNSGSKQLVPLRISYRMDFVGA